MTVLNDRSPILVEQFEAIARGVAREAEGVHLELINGKLGVKPVPDGIHDTIVAWLSRICIQARPELWFYAERGLAVETYRSGRAKADGLLTEGPSFLDDKDWADTAPVLLGVGHPGVPADRPRQLRSRRLLRPRRNPLRDRQPSAFRQGGPPPGPGRHHAGHRATQGLGPLTALMVTLRSRCLTGMPYWRR
jgi:hypothetical protein